MYPIFSDMLELHGVDVKTSIMDVGALFKQAP